MPNPKKPPANRPTATLRARLRSKQLTVAGGSLLGNLGILIQFHINHYPCVSQPWRQRDVLCDFSSAAGASMPGNACAIFRNNALTLYPAFALVSMNKTFCSLDFVSPSSVVTCLGGLAGWRGRAYRFSAMSVLFPTRTIITSFPRSARTSSIHFVVLVNEFLSDRVNSSHLPR